MRLTTQSSLIRAFAVTKATRYCARTVMFGLFVSSAVMALCARAHANDQMFAPQPAAASSINWQDNYFAVKGAPTFIWSGSMHFARLPKEKWRERMVAAKRAGINTIESYIFWNAQEPQDGVFDFGVTSRQAPY